jgi:hypothetical protein
MVGRLVNDELKGMWKEMAVADLMYYSDILLEGLRI